MKKHLSKRLLCAVLALLLSLSLMACGTPGGGEQPFGDEDAVTVSLINELQAEYLQDEYDRAHRYASGMEEYSRPAPVSLTWEDSGAAAYQVKVGEKEDLSDARIVKTTEAAADIYNCKIDTRYYWSVSDDNGKEIDSGSFRTSAEAPRAIYCDGITNMRDMGGWMTDSGKRVNQGLLYRCGRLNANSEETVTPEITEAGLATMAELGIKTELDLRRVDNNEVGGLTDTSLIDGAQYIQIPMLGTVGALMADNESQIPLIFDVLADESNYPLIMHCSIGTDRTGFIAYLVNGLLGVDIEDLNRDYLLSNFATIGGVRMMSRIENDYIAGIDAYPGAALSERIENYLLDVGVTQEEIDSVRAIMLG